MNRDGWTTSFLVCLIAFNCLAFDEKAIVDGASQFLMERARQNYMYIFQKQIEVDSLFLHYFPRTSAALSDLDLAMLLTNRKYIREGILTDIENIGYLAVRPSLDSATSRILRPLKVLTDTISKYDSTLSGSLKKEVRDVQKEIRSRVSVKYRDLDAILGSVRAIVDIVNSSAIDTLIDKYEKMLIDPVLKSHVKGLGLAKFIGDREILKLYAGNILDTVSMICDTSRSFTSRVVASLDIIYRIERLRQIEQREASSSFVEKFNACRKYCLFFAQICDAESPEVVKQILTSVSLPPVSFELKRQAGTFGFFVNSYLGIGGGYETGRGQGGWYYGLCAPIGIEAVWGLSCGWSAGAFVSMIDLGKAINAQIYQETTPQIAQIVAPGIGASFGFPHVPLSAQVLYSYGAGVRAYVSGAHHLSGAFVVDMPLLKLFSKDISKKKVADPAQMAKSN